MRWWVVVAEWFPEPCWECSGSTGKTWDVVAAETAEQAIQMALVKPEMYDPDRDVWVFELEGRPAPQMKKPRHWRPGLMPYPSVSLYQRMEAPKPQWQTEDIQWQTEDT